MKLLVTLAALACVVAIPASAFAKTIRVRLSLAQKSVRVSGFGLRLNGASTSPSILPTHSELVLSSSSVKAAARVSGDLMKVNGTAWPGDLVVQPSRSGLDLVAHVDLDDYMRGVLPSEMPLGWPLAALRAQAVASRSYVLAEAAAHSGDAFDVDNTVASQVFNWQKYARAPLRDREKTDLVLNETRNEVLVGLSGQPYLAYFHSDCGGVTEDARNVWGGGVATVGKATVVHDPHCAIRPASQWQQVVSLSDVQLAAREYIGDDDLTVSDVRILDFSSSGRVQNIALSGSATGDTEIKMTSQDFRQMMGYSRIKSTLFSLEHVDGSALKFVGRGYGHGVGLCQQGARFMAAAGANYHEILKRYYPAARLGSL